MSIAVETNPNPPASTGALSITDKSVLVALTLSKPGSRRKVDTDLITTDADNDMVSVSKKILDCPEFDAIKLHDHQVRTFIKSVCLPSPFKTGIYLLPNGFIADVDERLQQMSDERDCLINNFMAVYADAIANAAERLGSLYDAQDYPSAQVVRLAFDMAWQYLSFSTPERLRAISPEMFAREQKRFQEEVTNASEQIKILLRGQLKMLIDRAAERLQPGEDGKPRIFRDSLVTNITDFLTNFEARNIADDKELRDLTNQMKGLIAGIEPGDLRSDADLRSEVQAQFTEFAEKLGDMTTERPIRRITLEE